MAGESGIRLEGRLDKITEKRIEQMANEAMKDPKRRNKTIRYLRNLIDRQKNGKVRALAIKEIEAIQIIQLLELLKNSK